VDHPNEVYRPQNLMDFLDETHTTRWASVCVFSNILLILLAVASGVLEPPLSDEELPLLLPQTLLTVPLLLQLLCLAIFTFSARSGALQLFKYQLRIPFLGRWMLPIIVLALSIISLGVLSRGLLSATSQQSYPAFLITITTIQLVLHFLHLLNLTWGFVHYLWTSRPKHYQPIQRSTRGADVQSSIRSFTSSGHLSRAYLSLSESRDQPGFEAVKAYRISSGNISTTLVNDPSIIELRNDRNQVEVIDHNSYPGRKAN
jgi:hypothetical protein